MSDRDEPRRRSRFRRGPRTPEPAAAARAVPAPPAAGAAAPAAAPAAPAPAAASRGARSAARLGRVLRSPARPGEPLFAQAPKAWQRLLPFAVTAAFVASLLPVTVVVLIDTYGVGGGWAGALGVAQTVPLLLAVTRPVRAWAIVLAADAVGALLVLGSESPAGLAWPWTPMGIVGYLVVMVCLGLREPVRTLIGVWLATGAAGVVLGFFQSAVTTNTAALLFVLSGALLAVTGSLRGLGDAQQRVAEQESISEAERARRTLLEERARIARELHDVVAHHMSVITVQADSAPYRLPGMAEPVREEFAAIAASARESLGEMRRLLTVLRSDRANGANANGAAGSGGGPGGGDGAERAPQPGIGRIQQLVEATVRAGQPVELSLAAGADEAAPPAVDLSAYRIVQEALANVVRHAPGARARVSVTYDAQEVIVLVVNGPGRDGAPVLETAGTGHGLVGMRERVRLTGGTLDTGPLPDGGFRVAARLPLNEPSEDAS
ncbi:sensor histidine kinase [Streptomyces sp. NPDC090445]|uniref:sensor histidine kinase n=1 Tax=Streptomyces sp. NPDC090445 TaxID=3365963 RepID=UPI0038022DB2